MVPRKVGEELRRRRILLGLMQRDIANAIGSTRAYVSAIEHGVSYDPDADKLVAWALALGWEQDYLLRKLGRISVPAPASGLPPELVREIERAIERGVRRGVAEAILEYEQERGRAEGPAEPAREPAPQSDGAGARE